MTYTRKRGGNPNPIRVLLDRLLEIHNTVNGQVAELHEKIKVLIAPKIENRAFSKSVIPNILQDSNTGFSFDKLTADPINTNNHLTKFAKDLFENAKTPETINTQYDKAIDILKDSYITPDAFTMNALINELIEKINKHHHKESRKTIKRLNSIFSKTKVAPESISINLQTSSMFRKKTPLYVEHNKSKHQLKYENHTIHIKDNSISIENTDTKIIYTENGIEFSNDEYRYIVKYRITYPVKKGHQAIDVFYKNIQTNTGTHLLYHSVFIGEFQKNKPNNGVMLMNTIPREINTNLTHQVKIVKCILEDSKIKNDTGIIVYGSRKNNLFDTPLDNQINGFIYYGKISKEKEYAEDTTSDYLYKAIGETEELVV